MGGGGGEDVELANMVDCNASYLSHGQDEAIFVTKLVFLVLSFIANIAAIVVLVYFKSYRRFVFRLILCLLAASLVGATVQILEIIPLDHQHYPIKLRNGSAWGPVCASFGFLDNASLWMSNFVIIWIVGFLCWLMSHSRDKINFFYSKVSGLEAVAICLCFLVPFTFNWIPFTTNHYGPSGHWCWIKLTEPGNCWVPDGAGYIFALYYGPLMVIMLVTSLISVVAVVQWCRNIVRSDPMNDLIFIVIYPIVFNIVCAVMTANRIEEVRRVKRRMSPYFNLWLAHAIADATRTLLPALFVLLQFLIPTTRKLVVQSRYEPISSQTKTCQASSNTSRDKKMYTSL